MRNEKKFVADNGGFEGVIGVPLKLPTVDSCLPDPYLYEYYDGIKNRTLYLEDDIGPEVILLMSKMILAWNREDKDLPVEERKPIKVMIYSYGGEVDATLHFIDLCLASKTPIYTYNMGVAMSGGFYILLAGSKRFAFKNSQSLCHQGSGSFTGEAENIKSHTTQYNKILNKLYDYVLERTTIPKDVFNKKKKTEWFINGDEQIKLGIVDKLIDSIDELI